MKRLRLGELKNSIIYVFLNYFTSNIPCWTIRKFIYRCFGMKIGSGSRIMMKCIVLSPSNICIGDRTIVNEFCFLDGRGGLSVGNDCAISVYSKLITGSHDYNSANFKYINSPISIGDNIWICSGAVIISPAKLEDFTVIGAYSLVKGHTEPYGIYSGNPAQLVRNRMNIDKYHQDWKTYFR